MMICPVRQGVILITVSGDRRTGDVMLAISVPIDALRYRRADEINVISLLHELLLSSILNSNFT